MKKIIIGLLFILSTGAFAQTAAPPPEPCQPPMKIDEEGRVWVQLGCLHIVEESGTYNIYTKQGFEKLHETGAFESTTPED